MLEGKRVAVVVPAHDEQELIATTLAGLPGFVDRVYVVDDGSGDGTADGARRRRPRVEVLAHDRNRGVVRRSSPATSGRLPTAST
jgi:glycosyltransferase involved in cell wall biosynthesis